MLYYNIIYTEKKKAEGRSLFERNRHIARIMRAEFHIKYKVDQTNDIQSFQ